MRSVPAGAAGRRVDGSDRGRHAELRDGPLRALMRWRILTRNPCVPRQLPAGGAAGQMCHTAIHAGGRPARAAYSRTRRLRDGVRLRSRRRGARAPAPSCRHCVSRLCHVCYVRHVTRIQARARRPTDRSRSARSAIHRSRGIDVRHWTAGESSAHDRLRAPRSGAWGVGETRTAARRSRAASARAHSARASRLAARPPRAGPGTGAAVSYGPAVSDGPRSRTVRVRQEWNETTTIQPGVKSIACRSM